MQNFYNRNRQLVWGVLVGVVSVYLISSVVVEKRLSELQSFLDSEIVQHEEYLKELASVTGRGGVNEHTSSVVRDCTPAQRKEFDTLLSSLDQGLSKSDLQTLNNLFGRCGYVFANQRASMVGQLQQRVLLLEELEFQRTLLGNLKPEESKIEKWKELQENENELQNLFFTLVDVQGKIIESLLAGQTTNSNPILSLREEASEIQSKLGQVTTAASSLRSDLVLP